jgi:FkbM family methyltransferase
MSNIVAKLKVVAGAVIANFITGRFIAFVFKQRIPFYDTVIDVSDPLITNHAKASIFWRLYEKHEVAFAKKYLTPHEDIIELGSSIGVIGSIISQIQKSGKFVSVEANPSLIEANKKNLATNRKGDYVLINKAIDYFNKTVPFALDNSTLDGKITREKTHAPVITVDTITLNEICIDNNITNFTLISDIEGAEITFLLHDTEALSKCHKMIIELHDTEYNGKTYSVNDMVQLTLGHNFKIIDQYSPIFVFQKIS